MFLLSINKGTFYGVQKGNLNDKIHHALQIGGDFFIFPSASASTSLRPGASRFVGFVKYVGYNGPLVVRSALILFCTVPGVSINGSSAPTTFGLCSSSPMQYFNFIISTLPTSSLSQSASEDLALPMRRLNGCSCLRWTTELVY